MAFTPEQLGNYLLLEKIAQGGMAQVFKAKTVDPQGIERLVVIKRILPHISSDPEYIQMLVDEAKIAVHFNHGNIAQIYDLGRIGDDYFIVMEYVDGKTLGQILREFKEKRRPIPLEIIAYCVAEMCQALDYMHRRKDENGRELQVVHRDVSPQNIILSYSGNVKLIDFGVAKAVEKVSHTQSGVLKGKFAYMSPEQAEGEKLDNRSDIFSTGIMLWELLTQERLFKKESNKDTLRAVKVANYIRPSKYRQEVSAELDSICEKALQRKKEKRYKSASEMSDDLNRFLIKNFPNFRRVDVARFLYQYFGPEADEVGLEPEFPDFKIKKVDEEITLVEKPQGAETRFQKIKQVTSSLIRRIPKVKVALLLLLLLTVAIASWQAMKFWERYRLSTLTVRVDPPDAHLIFNDRPVAAEDGLYQFSIEPGKKSRLKVSKEGYLTQTYDYHLGYHQSQEEEIVLKKDIPPFGTLKINTNPFGATVYINDVQWHQNTPTQIPQIKSDHPVKVGIYLDGHEFVERTITIKKGSLENLSIDLKPKAAQLYITSKPEGADISLDGQMVGKTPFVDKYLRPDDKIDIEITMEGMVSVDEEVLLKAGENRIFYELKKKEIVDP